jgi:outer membrane receptor protein involved in Fe transport
VPNVDVDPQTTLDLVFDYQTETGPLGDMGFTLAILNLFDQEPSYMKPGQTFYVPYDSTNQSALGRTVNATVTKRF